jgi:conjugative transfer region lipoprotein (TIGR03751 family)
MGCASNKDLLVKEDTPTIKEIYGSKFGINKEGSTHINFQNRPVSSEGNGVLVDSKLADLKTEFQFLPNPTLVMYIYSHLTDAGRPVPGYATFFTFYEKAHFALSSESDHKDR